jgi:protocatechuate 3,4-dioxygenase beta subunit
VKRVAVILLSTVATVLAQESGSTSAPKPMGKVTGRVFCQDTGRPARFAEIVLMAERPSKNPLIDPATLGKDRDVGTIFARAMTAVMKESELTTVTGLDGSFSLEKVPPGTYYVIADLAGYLSPVTGLSQKERISTDETVLSGVKAAAEKVVVEADRTATVTVELVRGATLSGRVIYGDGTAAAKVVPVLLRQDKDGKWKQLGGPGSLPAITDDQGRFYFYGLAAGQYAVKAALPTTHTIVGVGPGAISTHMGTSDAMVAFSGGAMREKEIKPVEVKAGEQRRDVEVVFPTEGLHTVSGSVVAKYDHHAVNSATVELRDPDTGMVLRFAVVSAEGSFDLHYVPAGTYRLAVTGAADRQQKDGTVENGRLGMLLNSKVVRGYGPMEMPLVVKGDTTGLTLEVPDAPMKPVPPKVPGQ